MSKLITYVPLLSVERVELRITNCRKTLSQVKAETRAHYVFNGGMWSPDGTLCPLLKVGGAMLSGTPWRPMGYVWDKGPDIYMTSGYEGAANFIAITALIPSGKPVDKPPYGSAQGGKWGRSAIGLRGGSLALYCPGDGTGNATAPEALWDELVGLGWASVVMLDRGGSSQCDSDGERITASRKVYNWVCVYSKQAEQTPSGGEDKPMSKYTVTPNIGVSIRSGPGAGYGKVGAYPMGTVVDVLEERNGWGRMNKGWTSLACLGAVKGPQRVMDTSLVTQTHLVAPGIDSRPGGSNPCKYITIHKIGNAVKSADAVAHTAYPDSDAGECDLVSWYYSADDHAIIQNLPDAETAHHTGDGKSGSDNVTSIGIKICVNAGGDFEVVKVNAAALVRLLMEEHGIHIDHVVQHNHWNDKGCPKTTRVTPGAWKAFLTLCRGESTGVSELGTAANKLAAVEFTGSPDYWKGGDYSAENVQAPIIKWVASC